MSQPQCPKCSSLLNDDYGMVTCAKCGSVVFIDMDGVGHFSGGDERKNDLNSEDSSADSLPLAIPAVNYQSSLGEDQEKTLNFQGETKSNVAFDSHTEYEQSALLQNQNPPEGIEQDQRQDRPPVPEEEFQPLDFNAGFEDQEMLNKSLNDTPNENFAQPGDPLGTSAYANSEISQAKDGPLLFKILIMGIDSKEIRDSLRSALDDQRFAWNPNDLMSRISKGTLLIEKVAPVKAVILINRIKRLPVKVRWGQNAITQMDSF